MTITAKSVVRRVVETLQDTTSIRWPVGQLVRYLNDAQREIYKYRPDCTATGATKALTTGTKQSLPTGGQRLLDVIRNTNGPQVRMVTREILDANVPGWHSLTGTTTIKHYMYDVRDPLVFYVYPPAADGASLEIVHSVNPTDIAEPADGATWEDVTGNLSVQDIFANDVRDLMCYYAYSKDAEYAGNLARAQAHYAAFANSVGIELKASMESAPSTKGNANVLA